MELYYCSDTSSRLQAYSLLALAAARHWGLPVLPVLARNAQGKPFFPEYPQYQFNLSHSGSIVACLLDDRPVGVDVERLRPHHPQLPRRICSPDELVWLKGEPDFDRALCQLWTLKESRVKQEGTGLTVPIRSVSIPLPPPCRRCARHGGLTFSTLDGPDWSLSLCGHSPLTTVIPIRATSLPPVTPVCLSRSESQTD